MKKNKIILFILLVSIYSYSQEKNVEEKKSSFSLIGGMNVVIPDKSSESSFKSYATFGYQLGVRFNIPITKTFSFIPEIDYQSIGNKTEYTYEYSNGTLKDLSKFRASFLILPFDFKKTVSSKFAILLGPNVALNLKSKSTTISSFSGDESFSRTYTESGRNSKLTLGANLGFDYDISNSVFIELKYTLFIRQYQSLSNTLDNSIFGLSAGYNLN